MTHYPNERGEYKTKRVETKWYPSDLATIDRQAKIVSLSRTDYITRSVLNSSVIKSHVFKVNWRTYQVMGQVSRELRHIGNNINQIAKVLHQERLEGGSVPANYPLPEELNAIRSYVTRIDQELNTLRLLLVGKDKN